MKQLHRTLEALLVFFHDLIDLILTFLGEVDRWCHAQLKPLNLQPESETVILLFLFVLVAMVVARWLSGLLRILLVVLLVGLTLDILVPALQR